MPKTQTYLILSSLWCELISILCAPLPQPAGCEALCAARAQYVDHPADFCFRLPDGLSHEQGAFAEPLSVGAQPGCTAGAAHPSCAGRASVLRGSYSLLERVPFGCIIHAAKWGLTALGALVLIQATPHANVKLT